MMKRLALGMGILFLGVLLVACRASPTPTPVPPTLATLPGDTPALTPTVTPSPTPTDTPTPTATVAPLSTPCAAPTETPETVCNLAALTTPPATCGPAGAEAHAELPPPLVLPDIVLERGTVITVTSDADAIDGDVSSLRALLANPGSNGVALREAMEVTNNDSGSYTIRFGPELDGAIIRLGHWLGQSPDPLPLLSGGSVIIDGDIDGDGRPDVIVQNDRPDVSMTAFEIASSNNTLHALELAGFRFGVALQPKRPGTTFSNNTVSNMVIREASGGGVVLYAGPPNAQTPNEVWDSENSWTDLRIVGNSIEAEHSGIALTLHRTQHNLIERVTIAYNDISISPPTDGEAGYGICVQAGYWAGADANVLRDITIAHNRVEGSPSVGIQIAAGSGGSGSNLAEDVQIIGNTVRMTGLKLEYRGGMNGIALMAGDGAADVSGQEPSTVVYPVDNVVRRAAIVGNRVEGAAGEAIWLIGGCDGASRNKIEEISILGNVVGSSVTETGSIGSGISINGAGGGRETPRSFGNEVSDVVIHANTVQVDTAGQQPRYAHYGAGAIYISGGDFDADRNLVTRIWITNNRLDSIFSGIRLMGGVERAAGNVVSGIEVWCNQLSQAPIFPDGSLPAVKGIHLTGGAKQASGNRLTAVRLMGNWVAGAEDDVSAVRDVGDGASGNKVDYSVVSGQQ